MCQRYSIGKASSSRRMPGELNCGKPSIARTPMCLRPMRGSTPPEKSCEASTSLRSTGIAGLCKGMIDTGNGAMQVAQQSIEGETGVACDMGEPLGVEQSAEDILKSVDLGAEMFESCLGGASGRVLAAFVEPAFEALLGGQRGQVGQGEKVLGFEMRAFLHELLAALVVDDAGDRIGKAAAFGIAGGARADGIAFDHPSGTQA